MLPEDADGVPAAPGALSSSAAARRAVVGLDLGTGGARALVVAEDGELLGSGAAPIAQVAEHAELAAQGRHEQEPEGWWSAAREALGVAVSGARRAHSQLELAALSVDGTSGTVVGVDAGGGATTRGIMYDDGRAVAEAAELEALRTAGAPVAPTSGSAKMLWVERHLPAEFEGTHRFQHQADFVAARLGDCWGVTDGSNALKSGFDLQRGDWADWLEGVPGLFARLPRVVEPGAAIGALRHELAAELGLPAGLPVVAGVSDGTAAFLASGATRPGEDNTTLGTTLVFKRVAEEEVRDPGGLLYCHRLPGGVWLPGAASNVGGGWIRAGFPGADLAELDRLAAALLPSPHVAYPTVVRGERFPFRSAEAEAFCEPPTAGEAERFAANLQGTALIERLAYEVLDEATGTDSRSHDVFATGGGARSDLWLQLRSDSCGRTYHRPACSESAFGAAVIAAGHALFDDLWQASRALVRIEGSFHPDPELSARYDEYHARLRDALTERGYLGP